MLFIILAFFPLFSLSCLPSSENCLVCSFEYYDRIISLTHKLSFSKVTTDCQKKYNSTRYRSVLVLNSECSTCQLNAFDHIYFNLAQAFEKKSVESFSFLYSEINIFLQPGDHFIEVQDFEIENPQLFRRTLSSISLKPLSGRARIIIKTNKFFIFISKGFFVENLDFIGNDLLLGNNIPIFCNTSKSICCDQENILNNNFSPCYLINKMIMIIKLKA